MGAQSSSFCFSLSGEQIKKLIDLRVSCILLKTDLQDGRENV